MAVLQDHGARNPKLARLIKALLAGVDDAAGARAALLKLEAELRQVGPAHLPPDDLMPDDLLPAAVMPGRLARYASICTDSQIAAPSRSCSCTMTYNQGIMKGLRGYKALTSPTTTMR